MIKSLSTEIGLFTEQIDDCNCTNLLFVIRFGITRQRYLLCVGTGILIELDPRSGSPSALLTGHRFTQLRVLFFMTVPLHWEGARKFSLLLSRSSRIYNLASPVNASSAQVVRGTNLPHSSGSDHNPVLQKWNVSCWGKDLGSLFDIVVLCSDIIILVRIGLCIPKEFQLSSSVPELIDGVLNLPWSFGIVVKPFG
ncbi:hypothetical protein KY284_023761 [Solanum tuberosum]|nr:hypothetical protein KY284_023761 [Solanum tuberosum]